MCRKPKRSDWAVALQAGVHDCTIALSFRPQNNRRDAKGSAQTPDGLWQDEHLDNAEDGGLMIACEV